MNMILSAEHFVQLRLSDDVREQYQASHEAADESVWHTIIQQYPALRKWVAHNKTIPISILHILAKDQDPQVRWHVAIKRSLNDELFTLLSRDQDESVRRAVMNNAKCPRILSRG
jgi:hypothetical protein